MSSKKKKTTCAWVVCERCSAQIHDRDAGNHEKDCPPSECLPYPYILNGVLFCDLDVVTGKDTVLTNLHADCYNSLIFISSAALQLCNIPIGSWVKVLLPSGETIVRNAWRAHDRAQLSASIHEKDFAVPFIGRVTIRSFEEHVELAGEILLEGDAIEESDLHILQKINHDRVFCISNRMEYSFFGKKKSFNISSISPWPGGTEARFFKSMRNTVWRINGSIEVEHTENVQFAGMQNLRDEIDEALQNATSSENLDMPKARGLLLYGTSGTGKSLLVNSAARRVSRNIIVLSNPMEKDPSLYFDSILQRASVGAPSVIIIDNLDLYCGKTNGGNDSKEAFALSAMFDRLHSTRARVMVLATTNNIDDISRCLRRPGRFDRELEIRPPTPKDRLEILASLLGDGHQVNERDLKTLADSAHGFVGADIRALVSKASVAAAKKGTPINSEHLKMAFPLIRPSAMREIMVQVPNVKWEEVGGQADLKLQLRQAVEWPLKYPESFKRLGISPPRGLLMYGPPGCSKTLIAKALATESGLNFFSIKGPELFSCWVGDSEKAVREVFRRARQASPAIVFFDELDALAGERSGSNSGGSQVQERVLAQLLTELDGVEALGDVVVVGATNRPDRIDPALLRPGRLDRVVYVPLPDAATRRDIFNIQLRRIPVAADVNVDQLVLQTDGYSGAEVAAVCREAAMEALNEDFGLSQVHARHFQSSLKSVTPRTSQATLQLCEQYKRLRISN